jgi:hypothetical protein
MAFVRDWVCWFLLVGALACFVAGAFPFWSNRVDPVTGDKVSEFQLGLRFSPSFQYIHRDRGNGGFTTDTGVNWLSWSSLVLLLGFGGLELIRWRLKK